MSAINQIIRNNEIITDLTQDTVTAADVLSGIRFHLSNGVEEIGQLKGKVVTINNTIASTSLTFSVDKKPDMFICRWEDEVLARSGTNMIMVYFNGINTYGAYISKSSSTSRGYLTLDADFVSWSYSGTTEQVTITSSQSTYKFKAGNFKLIYI